MNQFTKRQTYCQSGSLRHLGRIVSGLLGVGGGGIISPLIVILGFNPKKIAVNTAFLIPFSSLTGFTSYLAMGYLNFLLVIPVRIAAYMGHYLGTRYMQSKLFPAAIKKYLAIVVLMIGFKMLFNIL